MRNKLTLFILLLAGSVALAGQTPNKLLYTGTFTSPYSTATTATLEIWGFAGDSAQEKVNYEFKGPATVEENTVRIDFSSTILAKWTLSAVASPPTVRQVYQTLTGTDVATLPSTTLSYVGSMTVVGGTSQSLTSSTSAQNKSWDMGAPWAGSSTGAWLVDFEDKPNLDAMFTYDNGLASPKLSVVNYMYLPTKKVQLWLVKNNPLKVNLTQPSASGSTLTTTMTTPQPSGTNRVYWEAVNLWVDGVLASQSTVNKTIGLLSNGVRAWTFSWAYTAGKVYQLQAIDYLGNSQSVWYPKKAYTFDPIGKVVAVVPGVYHTVTLKSDGTVLAYGLNSNGQLGNNSTATSLFPLPITTLSGVVSVATGLYHSVALKADGTVWTWGLNANGQLGNNSTTESHVPVQVAGLSNVVAITAGQYFTVALKADGTVWAWGSNLYGQLGNNSTVDSKTPVQVIGLTNVKQISAGSYHVLALNSDGTVSLWGYNARGQLGNNSIVDSHIPIPLSGFTSVKSVVGGYEHSLLLKTDGTVWSWGSNSRGELGNNTLVDSHVPVLVNHSGIAVVALAAAMDQSMAFRADGTVWAWGGNYHGQLGNNSTIDSKIPILISNLTGVSSLWGGGYTGAVIKSDGTVWTWGFNLYGELGINSTSDGLVPVRTLGLALRKPLEGGAATVGLRSDGTVWSWGQGFQGALGTGSWMDRTVPVQVSELTGVASLASKGDTFSLSLKTDGTIWGWGMNAFGQLGDGTTTTRSTPVMVPNFRGVASISTGGNFSMALKTDGTVWAWGYNNNGQIGDGTTTTRTSPVQVANIGGIVEIANGGAYSLALKADGTVWTWGANVSGQLGTGSLSPTFQSTPVQTANLTGVVGLAAGAAHGLALKSDGSVWVWGVNTNGQLGDGTTNLRTSPVQIPNFVAVAVVAGSGHSVALKSDGTVWAWGLNSNGQLGDGTTTQRVSPVQVSNLSGVVALAAAGARSFAIKSDGSIWAWGGVGRQLGNGVGVDSSVPVRVSLPSLQYDSAAPILTMAAGTPPSASAPPTNQPIIQTMLSAKDNETDIDETTVGSYQNGVWTPGYQATITSNGSYTFQASDLAGHTARNTFTITNIDTSAPTVSITPSTTNWAKTVTLTATATDVGIAGVNAASWQYRVGAGGTWQSGSSVTVSQNSDVYFQVADAVGNLSSATSYSVTKIDNAAPTFSVSVPNYAANSVAGSGVSASDAGAGPDASSWKYWFSDAGYVTTEASFSVSGGAFSLNVSSVPEGLHTLYVSVADLVGNTATQSYTLTIDRTASLLTASVPSWANASLAVTNLTVANSGTPLDDNGWAFWFDSATEPGLPTSFAPLGGNAILAVPPALAEGHHTLWIRAKDQAGNKSNQAFAFSIDRTPPSLTFQNPATANSTLVVSGIVADDGSGVGMATGMVFVWLNADSANKVGLALGASTTSLDVSSLTLGTNHVTLQALDSLGNSVQVTHDVVIDRTGPSLTATATQFTSGAVSGIVATTDAISGTVTKVQWSLDSDPPVDLAVSGSTSNGTYSLTLNGTVAEGVHALHIFAYDAANNSTTFTINITVDRTPPTLGANVADFAVGNSLALSDVVSADDGLGSGLAGFATYWFDSASSNPQVLQASATSVPVTALAEGTHSLTLKKVDQAGNFSTQKEIFVVDRTAPVLTATNLTEDGRAIGEADYLQGGVVLLNPTGTDGAPMQYRFLVNLSGLKPTAEQDWNSAPWIDLATASDVGSRLTASLNYLYVQIRDAGGNLSGVSESALHKDDGVPGITTIRSTTHVAASQLNQTSALTTAMFRFTVGSTGTAGGLSGFEWKLFQASAQPSGMGDDFLQSDQSDGELTLANLSDNDQGQYYWLTVRAVGSNGKPGVWAAYPFRIDSTPPTGLVVTSSTHPIENVDVKGSQVVFQWNQPLDLTGIKSYYTKYEFFSDSALFTPSQSLTDSGWVATGLTSLTISGITGTQGVGISVAAEDWSGNVLFASRIARVDNTPPSWADNNPIAIATDAAGRKATVTLKDGSDDRSSWGSNLLLGVKLTQIPSGAEIAHWQYWNSLPSPSTVEFDGMTVGASYLVTMALEDGAGNRIEQTATFGLSADGTPVTIPPYSVDFSQTWEGFSIQGTTNYDSLGLISGQTAALSLDAGPLTKPDGSRGLLTMQTVTPSGPNWSPVPSAVSAPLADLLWTQGADPAPARGVSVSSTSGLLLNSLTMSLPIYPQGASDPLAVAFSAVKVGPAPLYLLSSGSAALPTGPVLTLSTSEANSASASHETVPGWTVTGMTAVSLQGSGWTLASTSQASPSQGGFSVWQDSQETTTWKLVLAAGAVLDGNSLKRATVVAPSGGFYLQTPDVKFHVTAAVIQGDRMQMAKADTSLGAAGLLDITDISVDGQGRIFKGPLFSTHWSGSLTTTAGTLEGDSSGVDLVNGRFVLTSATFKRADGSVLHLGQVALDSSGMGSGGAVVEDYDRILFQGFQVHATGGRIVGTNRVFDTATIFIPSLSSTGITLYGLGVSLANDQVTVTGVASGAFSAQTGYGTGAVSATAVSLSPQGVSARFTTNAPANWGGAAVDLGTRSLSASGTIGSGAALSGVQLTHAGYAWSVGQADVDFEGLHLNHLSQVQGAGGAAGPSFDGLTLKSAGQVVHAGTVAGSFTFAFPDWTLVFDGLRLEDAGILGEPSVALPTSLGGGNFALGTTTLNADGTFSATAGLGDLSLDAFGWTVSATGLGIENDHFRLEGVTVLMPGLLQGDDITLGSVTIGQDGVLLNQQNTTGTSLRGTNGFRVDGTHVTFSPRGLSMGGKVYLPLALGGGAVSFPDGQIFLEPDGAVVAEADNAQVSFSFASWQVTASTVIVDRSGMTFQGGHVNLLGVVGIDVPDITVYSTGELAVAGQSLAAGTFPLPGGQVSLSYSGLRFTDDGLHLSASISLPASWGTSSLDFDDILLTPEGKISANTSLHDVNLHLEMLGFDAHFDAVRVSREGFRLDGVAFQVIGGPLAGQSLTIDSAQIDYNGNLDLNGFGFAPVDLYGYKVSLNSLAISQTNQDFSLTGGIRLADSLPIPELQGAYIALSKFTMGFDGTIKEFRVTLDKELQFTVYDSWTLGVHGLTIDKNVLSVTKASLDLPASFNNGQLAVSGLSINLQTGALAWGDITVSGVSYSWNGLTFVLTKLSITQDRGLIFGGSVTLGEAAADGTPFPTILQNRTFSFNTLQILPSGLPGDIDASVSGLTGPLFSDDILLNNASVSFSNLGGSLVFGFAGGVKLGAGFPAGLAGIVLTVNDLRINVADGSFAGLDVGVTSGLGTVQLPGGISFQPASLTLKKTGGKSFEVGASGTFLLGSSFPGILQNKTITVSAFRMGTDGKILQLDARLDLPGDNPLTGGLTLADASVSVNQDAATATMQYAVSGKVKMGSGFLDGLAGLTLDIHQLLWDGTGALRNISIDTAWTEARPFFGGSTIANGKISLSGNSVSNWSVGIQGQFRLPTTGLPDGLAGLGLNIENLKFKSDGSIQDVSISSSALNFDIFGFAKLKNGHISLASNDARSMKVGLSGAILLPSSLPEGLKDQTITINNFSFTTAGQILNMDGALSLAKSIPLFAGITMDGASVGFSMQGVSLLNATVTIPPTMMTGLPTSIALTKVLVGWDGKIKDLAAGIGQANVTIGGFSTAITNLVLSPTGITIQKAALTLPPNLGGKTILMLNAGFTTKGGFTGTAGVAEIDQDILGFGLAMKDLTLDIGAKVFRIQTTTLSTPQIGTLHAVVQLNGVTISPTGVNLGGVGFDIPDYVYGGVGFRAIHLSFTVSGTSFEISGGGQAVLAGLGTLDAQVSFTNTSPTYPIGLKRAYFQYTINPGIALGTTGIFLNAIRGGFAYGPPIEVPAEYQPLFNQLGPRLQLGLSMSAPSISMTMDADFWIDVKNGAWAFDGNASVFSGEFTGQLGAGYGNNIFYGTFAFKMVFAHGKIQVWIFPYQGRTVLSGQGTVTLTLPKGSLISWPAEWWHPIDVYVPGSNQDFGGVGAEFGQFSNGAGVKGYVTVPVLNQVGVFLDKDGLHTNISDYSLVKPAGY